MAFYFNDVHISEYIKNTDKKLNVNIISKDGKLINTVSIRQYTDICIDNPLTNKLVYNVGSGEDASLTEESLNDLNNYLIDNNVQYNAKIMIDAVIELVDHAVKSLDTHSDDLYANSGIKPRIYKLKSMHTKNTDDVFLIFVLNKNDILIDTMQGYVNNKAGNLIRTTVHCWRYEPISFKDLSKYDPRWLQLCKY